MRVIKIDCVKKEIYEIDAPDGEEYKWMYKELEAEGYEMVRLSRTDALWVDESGLRRKPPLGAFKIEWYPQALPGHWLIVGLKGPASCSSKLSIEEVRKMVQFVDISELPLPVMTITSFGKAEVLVDYMKYPGKYKTKPSKN